MCKISVNFFYKCLFVALWARKKIGCKVPCRISVKNAHANWEIYIRISNISIAKCGKSFQHCQSLACSKVVFFGKNSPKQRNYTKYLELPNHFSLQFFLFRRSYFSSTARFECAKHKEHTLFSTQHYVSKHKVKNLQVM